MHCSMHARMAGEPETHKCRPSIQGRWEALTILWCSVSEHCESSARASYDRGSGQQQKFRKGCTIQVFWEFDVHTYEFITKL